MTAATTVALKDGDLAARSVVSMVVMLAADSVAATACERVARMAVQMDAVKAHERAVL